MYTCIIMIIVIIDTRSRFGRILREGCLHGGLPIKHLSRNFVGNFATFLEIP